MGRIVLAGTAAKLAKPTRAQLQLVDWHNSFLQWVDLSALTIPPLQNADVINYKAAGTKFANTDYTQFRFPIDLTGVTFPNDLSSYNHDFVVQVMRRAANATQPGVMLIIDHVAASYLHSWSDSIYRVMAELGMTPDEVRDMLEVTFAGYPRLLSRLARHMDGRLYRPDPPETRTTTITVDNRTFDLAGRLTTIDRATLQSQLRTFVSAETGQVAEVWVVQSVPHHTILTQRWPA